MTDWLKVVADHLSKCHLGQDSSLVLREGATSVELERLSASLGIALPTEFRALYSACNGFGVASRDQPGGVCWLFHPTCQIPTFVDDIRSWFRETHGQFADRFFPFIDFGNGDGIGYCLDESGELIEGLCCFKHEEYRFTDEQDVNEFISCVPVSIEEFLTLTAD